MKKRLISRVAFFGFADARPESRLYRQAYETARLLAKKGFTIVKPMTRLFV